MSKLYKFLVLVMLLASSSLLAQVTISGKVTNAADGEALIGANVFISELQTGAATDADGNFSISVKPGKYSLTCSFVGFEKQIVEVNAGQDTELNFEMKDQAFSLSVTVLASKVKERETPVAYATIEKKELEQKLASREIPMALNITPSVYATQQGGGSGDARISVRGFNQRNIAVMINGIPVNDMENGWVYWSNWSGLGDVAASLELQRGFSSINLATPAVGGTMNMTTDPTAQKMGGRFKQELGSGGMLKSTLVFNTGLIDNKWAMNAMVAKKTADGVIDKTWADEWSYYVGFSYNVDENNRLELYGMGAPQRHGQNNYRQNAASYDRDFAMDKLGYTSEQADEFVTQGREYNQNWGAVTSSYTGEQWFNGGTTERYDSEFLNERENYFHKPLWNFNWYSKFSEKTSLYTTAYWSGGTGGGTGTYGKTYKRDADGNLGGEDYKYYYGRGPWSHDWNETIKANQGPAGTYYVDKTAIEKEDGQSIGILRNSVNDQWTVGVVSKLLWKISEENTMYFAVDWRNAGIDHYREVRDLLGGNYYVDNYDDNEFRPEGSKLNLGDKIDYHNINDVYWLGASVADEWTSGQWSVSGVLGWSMVQYGFTDFFERGEDGFQNQSESDWIHGYQAKAGAVYRATTEWSVFTNLGYISKVPIFDNVIDDGDGTVASDPENEKFTTLELGVNYKPSSVFGGTFNVYYTTWKDRANTRRIINSDGTEDFIGLKDLDQTHMGVELNLTYMPISMLRLDAFGSIQNNTYNDDVTGTYKDYSDSENANKTFTYYLKDLKVGDAPQTSFGLTATVFPVRGLSFAASYRYYADFYADWDPISRTDEDDREQSWKTPSYGLLDAHLYYDIPYQAGDFSFQIFAHAFNILDEIYVSDATDESQYNAMSTSVPGVVKHSAQRAEINVGIPVTFNLGIGISWN